MRYKLQCLPIAIAASLAAPVWAQAGGPDLGSVLVTGTRELPAANATFVDPASVQRLRPATSDTAMLLRGVPGVSLYGAGGVSSLPSIRGLADDRIRIQVDGMDLIAACPNHMNPALSYLDPANVGLLAVYAGIAPVSVGGDSIAGTIVAASPQPAFAEPGAGLLAKGEVGAFYRSNGHASGGNLAATLANESLSIAYAGAIAESDNHVAARDFKTSGATGRVGRTLPLDEVGSTAYETRNHELRFAYRAGDHVVEAKLGYQDIPFQLWPNQRMDMLGNEQWRANVRYEGRFGWGTLEARAWREDVEHFMDFGDDKRYWYGGDSGGPSAIDGEPCAPIGPTCAAGMPMYTESTNTGVTVVGEVSLTERDLLRVGGLYQRYRLDDWWPASGGGMWPNTFWNINGGQRDRTALFAEWEGRPHAQWTALAGVRYERVVTDTGPVQAYNNNVAPATTLVPAFNGRDRERTDGNLDATLLARYTADATRSIEVGVARKVRSPSLYERYSWMSRGMEMLMVNWFGDGNGYVGDMDLVAETAHTVAATLDWHTPDRSLELKLTPYYTRVADYIDAVRCPASLGGACATQTPGGDKFVFLQLANQSARLYGAELSARAPIAENAAGAFGVELVASYVDGENRDTGDNLYNLMPLNALLTVTHRLGGWDNTLEWVVVKAKSDVSAVRNEVATPGYGLLNLRASYSWPKVRFDFGVDNLLDKFYTLPLGGAYLGQGTTMTATPVGSVPRWGLGVPGMGRSVYAGVTVSF
jgi:iron complex outermembrane receptor protein